jgi:hypothetical protein
MARDCANSGADVNAKHAVMTNTQSMIIERFIDEEPSWSPMLQVIPCVFIRSGQSCLRTVQPSMPKVRHTGETGIQFPWIPVCPE